MQGAASINCMRGVMASPPRFRSRLAAPKSSSHVNCPTQLGERTNCIKDAHSQTLNNNEEHFLWAILQL